MNRLKSKDMDQLKTSLMIHTVCQDSCKISVTVASFAELVGTDVFLFFRKVVFHFPAPLTPDQPYVKRPPPSLQITSNFLVFYELSHDTTLKKRRVWWFFRAGPNGQPIKNYKIGCNLQRWWWPFDMRSISLENL